MDDKMADIFVSGKIGVNINKTIKGEIRKMKEKKIPIWKIANEFELSHKAVRLI